MATIDVLLPTKNVGSFLRASLDSVLAQTFEDWRLLVLDHGSTDGTLELVEQYAARDKRIVVLSNPEAVGLGGLLNYGLDQANGRIAVRQDGDDISLPDRFQKTVDMFSVDPGLVVVSGEAHVIDLDGNALGYIRRAASRTAISSAAFFYNPIAHPAAAFNLEHLDRLGIRYGKDFLGVLPAEKSLSVYTLAEDYFLFGQLALLGKCINIQEPLIQYRYHAKSESVAKRAAQNNCAIAISRFLALSLTAMKGGADFDPAPFCSHAECVFDLGQPDYSDEFNRMAGTMRMGLGVSPELERELAFRRVLAKRSVIGMGSRYISFGMRNGLHSDEYRLIRNWLARSVRDKYAIPIDGGIAPWRGDRA